MSVVASVWNSVSSIVEGVDAFQTLGNHLQCAVVELRRGLHPHVFAIVETAVDLIVGIPQHGGHGAGAVGQTQLQIEIPVAIRAQLFVGDQKHLIDRFVFAQLIDEATCHVESMKSGR